MKGLRLIVVALFVLAISVPAFAGEVKRIDKDELKSNLDSYIIVDVRRGADWKGSEFKIKGALRPEGDLVDYAQGQGWDKGAKIVLYCA